MLFFAFFFDALAPEASVGALAAADVAAVAAGAASLAFFDDFEDFDAFAPEASAGAAGAAVAAVVAGVVSAAGAAFVVVDFAGADVVADFAPVGGADEPLIVKPDASRFTTDLLPMPLTRAARSSAFLNGPFFVRSSMIAFACAGPMPLTDSSAA